MIDKNPINLIEECKQALNKIEQIEQQIQIEINKLEKRSSEKITSPPGGGQKRRQKSSRRRK